MVSQKAESVAVVGLACRLPRASTPEEVWRVFEDGEDLVGAGEFPPGRARDLSHARAAFAGKLSPKEYFPGSYFDDVSSFDAGVFGVPDTEALYMEPEQRMFLEATHECLERAGYAGRIRGTSTGVYVGHTFNKYRLLLTDNHPSASHGNHSPFIGGRISYIYDLHGPGMMVCTGCSSSLLAVHVAARAVLAGECDMALAGGASLDLMPFDVEDDIWNQLGIIGPDVNKCRPFDDDANGIAKGEGVGVVLLKPLSRAIADGDFIHGVLRSTVANHDGASNGITAPNPRAQTQLLVSAWKAAGVHPDGVDYIETHGTGTKLGDPIEVRGINDAMRQCNRSRTHPCLLGAAKANTGHLADGAAGILGLIKVLLAMRHDVIPRCINIRALNSHIDWDNSAVRPCLSNSPWPRKAGAARVAGISAFGLLGTNVHCVVEDSSPLNHVEVPAGYTGGSPVVVIVTARTLQSLTTTLAAVEAYAQSLPQTWDYLVRLAFSMNCREVSRMPHRVVVVCCSLADLSRELKYAEEALSNDSDGSERRQVPLTNQAYYGHVRPGQPPARVSFLTDGHQVARALVAGSGFDANEYYRDCRVTVLPDVPTYCFDRKRYWPDTTKPGCAPPLISNGVPSGLVSSNGTPMFSSSNGNVNGSVSPGAEKGDRVSEHTNGGPGHASTAASGPLDTQTSLILEGVQKITGHEYEWKDIACLSPLELGIDSLMFTGLVDHLRRVGIRIKQNALFESLSNLVQTHDGLGACSAIDEAAQPRELVLRILRESVGRAADWNECKGQTLMECGIDSLLFTQLRESLGQYGVKVPLTMQFETVDALILKVEKHFAGESGGRSVSAVEASRLKKPEPVELVDGFEHGKAAASAGRLWIMHQLDTTRVAYNIGNNLFFNGFVDRRALSQAIQSVLDRHPVFRCKFSTDPGGDVSYTVIPSGRPIVKIVDKAEIVSAVARGETPCHQSLRNGMSGISVCAVHFGGQGEDYAPRLMRLRTDTDHGLCGEVAAAIRSRVLSCLNNFDELDAKIRNSLLKVVSSPSWECDHLDDKHLHHPAVSMLLLYVAQILTYARFLDANGLSQAHAATAISAVCGHSQGLATGAVVGTSTTDTDLIRRATQMSELLLVMGARCGHSCGRSSYGAALVVGLDPASVKAQVSSIPDVYVTIVNETSKCVIAGCRDGVDQAARALQGQGADVRDLPSSVPFHCAILQPVLDSLNADSVFPAEPVTSLSVISTVNGERLDGSLGGNRVASMILVDSVNWPSVCEGLGRVIAGKSATVYDMGPAEKSVAIISTTRRALTAVHADVSVLSAMQVGVPARPNFNAKAFSESELAQKFLDVEMTRPFNLDKPPLIRCSLGSLGEKTVFSVVVHHIVFDGWSHFNFYSAIFENYRRIMSGNAAKPGAVDKAFMEYSQWDASTVWNDDESRSPTADDDIASSVEYWTDRVPHMVPTVIPGDKLRPARFTFAGGIVSRLISAHTVSSLSQLGRNHNATLYQTLLTGLYVLIHRFSGATNLTVGTPLAERPRSEWRNGIGFFVNMLPLRVDVEPATTVRSLLRLVADTVAAGMEHGRVPFDRIVELVDLPPPDPSISSPLFNINLVLHNAGNGSTDVLGNPQPELRAARQTPTVRTSKWDLYFDFVPEGPEGSMMLRVEYYSGLYSREFADRIVDSFSHLLEYLPQCLDMSIASLPFTADDEANATPRVDAAAQVPPKSLYTHLKSESLLKCPAVTDGDHIMRYEDVLQEGARIQQFVESRGMARVGLVMSGPSAKMAVAAVGVSLAAKCMVTLDASWPAEKLRQAVDSARCDSLMYLEKDLRVANMLLWECSGIALSVCLDSESVESCLEVARGLMDVDLWSNVASRDVSDSNTTSSMASKGGWVTSYDGEPFSALEMEEFGTNVRLKLDQVGALGPQINVLEVGCASGLTMAAVAPFVGRYLATDLSPEMVRVSEEVAAQAGWDHVSCLTAGALEVNNLVKEKGPFDVVIVNSVAQYFPGHNYCQSVIESLGALLRQGGILFLGDVLDLDRRTELIESIRSHLCQDPHAKARLEWDEELFMSRDFLRWVAMNSNTLADVTFSEKIQSIANELSMRYDAIFVCKEKSRSLIGPHKKRLGTAAITSSVNEPCRTVAPFASEPCLIAPSLYGNACTFSFRDMHSLSLSFGGSCLRNAATCQWTGTSPFGDMGILMSVLAPLMSGLGIICSPLGLGVADVVIATMEGMSLAVEHERTIAAGRLIVLGTSRCGVNASARRLVEKTIACQNCRIDAVTFVSSSCFLIRTDIGNELAPVNVGRLVSGSPLGESRLSVVDDAGRSVSQGCLGWLKCPHLGRLDVKARLLPNRMLDIVDVGAPAVATEHGEIDLDHVSSYLRDIPGVDRVTAVHYNKEPASATCIGVAATVTAGQGNDSNPLDEVVTTPFTIGTGPETNKNPIPINTKVPQVGASCTEDVLAVALGVLMLRHSNHDVVYVSTSPDKRSALRVSISPGDDWSAVLAGISRQTVTAPHALVLMGPPSRSRKLAVPLALEYDNGRLTLLCERDGDRVGRRLVALIDSMSNMHTKVLSIPLLSSAEAAGLSLCNGETTTRSDRLLHELVSESSRRHLDEPAVSAQDGTLTYAELEERSDRLASVLHSYGVGRGVIVPVVVPRSTALVVAMLAVLKTGAAYCPLDSLFPKERILLCVGESNSPVCIGSGDVLGDLQGSKGKIWVDAGSDLGSHPAVGRGMRVQGSVKDLALCLYTSGSTGRPKQVPIRHESAVNVLTWLPTRLKLAERKAKTWLSVTACCFDIFNVEVFVPFLSGLCVHVASDSESRDPAALRMLMEKIRPDVMQSTPSRWQMLLDAGWAGGHEMLAMCGGEALSASLVKDLTRASCHVWNGYGPTETTMYSTCDYVGEDGVVGLGRPVANTHIYVMNSALQLQPEGVNGELCIGGLGVSEGYSGESDSSKAFVPDPLRPGSMMYRTGDIVRAHHSWLEYVGRADHQVKIRGCRVELGEVETAIASCPSVKEAACVLVSGELIAYVTPIRCNTRAVIREISQHLPNYMVPKRIHAINSLPLSHNGKLDRAALVHRTVPWLAGAIRHRIQAQLRQCLPSTIHSGSIIVSQDAPRNIFETKALMLRHEGMSNAPMALKSSDDNVCGKILGVLSMLVPVGMSMTTEDNFWSVGGDSIMAIHAIHRLSSLGIHLKVSDIFQHPTAGQLAQVATVGSTDSVNSRFTRGNVPETALAHPVAQVFLKNCSTNPDWYVLPSLLSFADGMDTDAMEYALTELVRRHDGLRCAFELVDGLWQMRACAARNVKLETLLLSYAPGPDILAEDAVSGWLTSLENSLSLASGRLLAAGRIGWTGSDACYTVIVAHHLAVDMVAWNLLLDDLDVLYSSRSDKALGEASSFVQYCDRLHANTKSIVARNPRQPWYPHVQIAPGTEAPLSGALFQNATIDIDMTPPGSVERLLQTARILQCDVTDLILTALALVMPNNTIAVESHGRVDVGVSVNTAGCATARYPIFLDAVDADEDEAIVSLVRRIRSRRLDIDDLGIGYLLAQNLGHPVRSCNSHFTHVGTLASHETKAWTSTPWPVHMLNELRRGHFHRPMNEKRLFPTEVFTWIFDGRLTIGIIRDNLDTAQPTTEGLGSNFMKALEQMSTLRPRTESLVKDIWTRELCVSTLAPNDNFFSLGGDSNIATRVISVLTEAQGVEIPLSAIHRHPTLASFTSYMQCLNTPLKAPSDDIDVITRAVSSAEGRMLLLQAKDPDSTAYVESLSLKVPPGMAMAVVHSAALSLVQAHTILHTVFSIDDDGVMRAKVVPVTKPSLRWIDVHDEVNKRQSMELLRLVTAVHSGEPVYCFVYNTSTNGGSELTLHLHHCAVDAAAIDIICKDLARILNGKSLTPVASTYSQYACKEQLYLCSEEYEADIQSWSTWIDDGIPPVPALFCGVGDTSFANTVRTYESTILPALAESIASTSQIIGVSEFQFMLAGYIIMLQRFTGQDEIMVSFPVSCRGDSDKGTSGMFVNTLPMKWVAVGNDQSLHEFILAVAKSATDVLGRQRVPFEHIARHARKKGSEGQSLLWNMFNMIGGLPPEFTRRKASHSKLPFSIDVHRETNGSMKVALEVQDGVLTDLVARSMLDCFIHTVSVSLTTTCGKSKSIGNLSVIPVQQLNIIYGYGNDNFIRDRSDQRLRRTSVQSYNTITELLRQRAGSAATAVICGSDAMSWNALMQRAHSVCQHLVDLGMGGTRVVIHAEKSINLIASILGVWLSGGCVIPITASMDNRLSQILSDSKAGCILSNSPSRLPAVCDCVVVDMDTAAMNHTSISKPCGSSRADSPAYMVYTSGSTGEPKGCVTSHQALLTMAHSWLVEYFNCGYPPGDITLVQWAPLSFDVFIGDLARAALCGEGTMVLIPDDHRMDVDFISAAILEHQASIIEVTPQVAGIMADSFPSRLASLDILVCGSDELNWDTLDDIMAKIPSVRVLNSYGLSEATIDSCLYDAHECSNMMKSGSVPIGRPMTGVMAFVLDRFSDQLSPLGAIGELCLAGQAVNPSNGVRAYLPTGEIVLRTGDVVSWNTGGILKFAGRTDRTSKVRGYRVSEPDIEMGLARGLGLPTTNIHVRVAKVGSSTKIIGYLVTPDGTVPSPALVASQLAPLLPKYMHPDFIVPVDAIPLTTRGKVDRSAFPPLTDLETTERNHVQPQVRSNGLEAVSQAWATVLGRDANLDEGLLEQADSLSLMRVHAILKKRCDTLSLADMFLCPTIGDLADRVSHLITSNSSVVEDDHLQSSTEQTSRRHSDDLAIVGVSLRLPGDIRDLSGFHEACMRGLDLVSDFPAGRRSQAGMDARERSVKGCFFDEVSSFDPEHFNIRPADAAYISVEQRKILEVATEALHEACGSNLAHSSTGVFVTAGESGYGELIKDIHPLSIPGSMQSVAASRVAYTHDLRGPAYAVDAACASGLVAVQTACDALRRGQCTQAVVAGANIIVRPRRSEGVFDDVGIISPDFKCKAFDTQANGTTIGEGVIALVLKTLPDAEAHGNHIYGVIKDTVIMNVGRSASISAPRPDIQTSCIRQVLSNTDLSVDDVLFVETHGTGTVLGDQVEMQALESVFEKRKTDVLGRLPITSSKAVFGHLDGAAGLLGVVRAIAAFTFGTLAPTANCTEPINSHPDSAIDVLQNPFNLPLDRPWYAGVTSLGLNGTTSHLLLACAPSLGPVQRCLSDGVSRGNSVIIMSGSNTEHIARQCARWSHYLRYTLGVASWSIEDAGRSSIRAALSRPSPLPSGMRLVIDIDALDVPMLDRLSQCHETRSMVDLCRRQSRGIMMVCCSSGEVIGSLRREESNMLLRRADVTVEECVSASILPKECTDVYIPREYIYSESHYWPVISETTNAHQGNVACDALAGTMLREKLSVCRELVRTCMLKPTEEYRSFMLSFENTIIVQFLVARGLSASFVGTESELFGCLGIHERYRKLYHVMIRNLLLEGVLRRVDFNDVHFDDTSGTLEADAIQISAKLSNDATSMVSFAEQRWPAYADQFRFPLYVSKHYESVLCGEESPISVLYPEGELFFVENNYTRLGDLRGDIYYNMYTQLICDYVTSTVESRRCTEDKPLYILECGAGMGLVTRQLLPKLKGLGRKIRYYFTDLGKAFVENARRIFADYECCEFYVFDITQPLVSQGIPVVFDVIVSYNVIHTTSSINMSVQNLRRSLSSDGNLFVIESTKNDTWATLAWGVLDGWWFFTDYDVRPSDPMLEYSHWLKVLSAAGFKVTMCPMDEDECSYVEKFLFVCEPLADRHSSNIASNAQYWHDSAERLWYEKWDPSILLGSEASEQGAQLSLLNAAGGVGGNGDSLSREDMVVLIQKELSETWKRLLNIKDVPADVPFRELGGESLTSVQMIKDIRAKYSVPLEISDIYLYPTLAELCSHIAQCLSSRGLDESQPNNANRSENICGFVFPGQGVQISVHDVSAVKASPVALGVFEEAEEILGMDGILDEISKPAHEMDTVAAALSTFLFSVASYEHYRSKIAQAGTMTASNSAFAGLSLGEFSALTCAGSLTLKDGLFLVHQRAMAMQEAILNGPKGGMVSLRGLDYTAMNRLLKELSLTNAWIATALAPNHFVVSGHSADLNNLMDAAQPIPSCRAKRLSVAGAFHSPCMASAAMKFNALLDANAHRFGPARADVILNTAAGHKCIPKGAHPSAIIAALKSGSVSAPLHWDEIHRSIGDIAVSDGGSVCEFGAGHVLTNIGLDAMPDVRSRKIDI